MTQLPPPTPSLDWCLFLDVDGTLIELTETPFDTKASEELKALLKDVSERLDGALALVSGRSIEYLDALFAPLRLPSAGLHGIERRKASGVLHGASFRDSQLDAARDALALLVQSHAGTLLEDKGRTIAIHFRMAPQFEPELREAVLGVAAMLGNNYHVQSGSMMLEIKPRGFHKGGAVKAFIQEPPFSGRTPVYVGDDLTDIDGFRVVEIHGGFSIAVGERVQGKYRLDDPAAVREWLEGIAGLVDSHHE
ncbi:MAG TPA: trehalose-phosphatase [Steroidobacteraceae bacterium]|jgi:trehalose 6-phosphate phosphatase|nr:trehalose-phosphatase [Steroidobacteraceae bacterium]